MPESLPVTSKHRKNQTNFWSATRKCFQAASLICFLLTLLFTKNVSFPAKLSDNLIYISPLVMISNLLSSKTFLTGSTLSLIILLSSLFIGRAWCGWLCPLGTTLDIFNFSKRKKRITLPQNLRNVKYFLLFVILTAAIFGNLTLLFLDPLTIVIRSSATTLLPILDKLIYLLERVFVKIPFMTESVYRFDAWLRPFVFPVDSASVQYSLFFGCFFIGILLLNLLAERFWCRYLCPLGALLGILSKLSLIQRRVNSTCMDCGLCSAHCPTGTIDPANHYKSDPSECTLCMNCRGSCQKNALTFNPKWLPARMESYDPNRRTFISSIGVSLVSLALFRINWIKKHPDSFLLRPPGVLDNEEFLSNCVRCGICIQTCPTQALQASFDISGIEGIGTPILIPRNGYCSFSCTSCGQHCPVNAIPKLELEEKRNTKIGYAAIDHNRCIAWSQHENCIVCEEMCPHPEKAIMIEKVTFIKKNGDKVEVSLPIVDHEKCTGCGICEYKCPVSGDAAIRVYKL